MGDGGPFGKGHFPGLAVAALVDNGVAHDGIGGVGGRAHGAVAHGRAVINQGHNGGGQRREAHADEQRSGQRGGRAEAGGAFDKRAEGKADDDGLDACVGCDVGKHPVDGRHGARALHGVHDQNRTEDNAQGLKGAQEAGDRVSRHGVKIHLPEGKSDDTGKNPSKRQSAFGGPVQCDHKYDGN
ncbi:hypothetical protein SDC9_105556 [bioreactor metagenome]|uniref:Uncharacterized protein n=1 Tax=bioreactor metagenome TaxID=1076179 RepID=A0A645B6G0_9ZZZZ